MVATVTGECTVLLLRKYGSNVCVVSFCFWSSCLIVYIHLRYINTQWHTITPIYSWSPSSRVSLLCRYYENRVLRFVWFRLIFIQLIIKFISIYPASTHSDEQQHHSTSLTSYHLATSERRDCIRDQLIFCEGDRNSNIIHLLQPSQKIHYFNQSVLAIVPDLNIFIWSIAIFDLIPRSALVQFFSIKC